MTGSTLRRWRMGSAAPRLPPIREALLPPDRPGSSRSVRRVQTRLGCHRPPRGGARGEAIIDVEQEMAIVAEPELRALRRLGYPGVPARDDRAVLLGGPLTRLHQCRLLGDVDVRQRPGTAGAGPL